MELPLGAEGWDAQAQAWVEAVSYAYGWVFLVWAVGAAVLLLLMTLFFVPAVRRRFWCVGARRAVEVLFEEYGLPGRRRPVAVLSCSAFDPPSDVQCTRTCLRCEGRVPLAEAPPAERFPSRSPVGRG
jgi:hypothetical protein